MEKVKGIFHEHKQCIISRLSGKRKQLLSLLQKNDLIKPWEGVKIKSEDDHNAFRSIFDLVEHRENEKLFIKILRDVDDEIANLIEKPPEATFWKPLPKKVYAELGSKIVLECELDKKYNTIWLKNKKNVNDDTNIEIKNNNHNGKHTITILQLKGTDIGKYSCICVSAETTCELKVQEPSHFVQRLEDKEICEGAKVVLECKLNAIFDEEPIWTKDGREISKSSPCIERENTQFVKKLTILKFNQNDEGVYQCVCETASTKANIKISAGAESQTSIQYAELQEKYRKCQEDLQNERLTVEQLRSEQEDLKRQVEELKNGDAELNKDKLREAEDKMKEMEKEIKTINLHIKSLQKRIEVYIKDLQKKDKTIQTMSGDVNKLLQLHKVTSGEQQEREKKLNEMIEGYNNYSKHQKNIETVKKENEKKTKELMDEIKKAQEATKLAEKKLKTANEAAERQAAKNKKDQKGDQTRARTTHRSPAETEVETEEPTLQANQQSTTCIVS